MSGFHSLEDFVSQHRLKIVELAELLRRHSRLTGNIGGNIETWLADPGTLPRYLELIPAPLPGESRFVEVGCYQPSVGYYLHLGWKEVVGLFKEDGEGTREETYPGPEGASVRFLRADVEQERIPLADGWADVVVMMEVFEHFAIDPMHALWEVNRVLKPGGRFVFTTPNAASFQLVWQILRGTAPLNGFEFNGYSTNRHTRLYDATELPDYIAKAGFDVKACYSRSYGHGGQTIRERTLRGGVRLWDWANEMFAPTGRKRERGHFLFLIATKVGSPHDRYPCGLYMDPMEWPGMAEQRDRLARLNGSAHQQLTPEKNGNTALTSSC